MIDSVTLREAHVADIADLFAVRTSVRENHLTVAQLAERGVTPATVAADLALPETRTWVAEVARAVVAFTTADARHGTVFALFVRPEAERRGIGRALLAQAEAWLFAAGWEEIWLTTDEAAHSRAHRLYRAAGWSLVGPAEHGDVRYVKRPITRDDG